MLRAIAKMFLTEDELAQLTGPRPRQRLMRYELQRRVLVHMGIEHITRARWESRRAASARRAAARCRGEFKGADGA